MKSNCLRRTAMLTLTVLIAVLMPLTGTAYASGEAEDTPPIVLRITPPTGKAVKSAPVEIRVTDHAGEGFQSVHVRTGGGWTDLTDSMEQEENRWYGVVDIFENCTVTARVTGPEGTVYEKSQYVDCFDTTSDHRDTSGAPSTSTSTASPEAGGTTAAAPDSAPASPPGGQGTVIEDVTNEDGREFFTISTPNENTFYLVIDKQKNSENVYFLNAVTESDLMALAETEDTAAVPEPVCVCKDKCVAGAVNTACPVCILSMNGCTGTAPASGQDTEPEEPDGGSNGGTLVIVLLVMLAAGGAGYYFKIYKPRHELDDAEDFDELTGGDEPTVNEDDALDYAAQQGYMEPGYGPEEPEDYGY